MKYKETKRGRFSRKAGGWAQGGFKFSAFVVGEESSSHPGSTFSEWGKESGWKALLYSFALCTEVPGAVLGSQGNRNVIGIKVYGYSSRFLLLITIANVEPCNGWKRMSYKQVEERGALGIRTESWGSGRMGTWVEGSVRSLVSPPAILCHIIPLNWRQPVSRTPLCVPYF